MNGNFFKYVLLLAFNNLLRFNSKIPNKNCNTELKLLNWS